MALSDSFTEDIQCNRCKKVFKLKNVQEIDEEVFRELPRSMSSSQDDRDILLPIVQKKLENIAMRNIMFPMSVSGIFTGDFAFVGDVDSLPVHDSRPFYIVDASRKLVQSVQDDTPFDHPLCVGCADAVHELTDAELENSKAENALYEEFLNSVSEGNEDGGIAELEEELAKSKALEAELEAEFRDHEIVRGALKEKLKSYEEEAESRRKELRNILNKHSRVTRELLLLDDSERSIKNQLKRAVESLYSLQDMQWRC